MTHAARTAPLRRVVPARSTPIATCHHACALASTTTVAASRTQEFVALFSVPRLVVDGTQEGYEIALVQSGLHIVRE